MPNVQTVRVILPTPIIAAINVVLPAPVVTSIRVVMGGGGSSITPLPARPTTLNEVINGGVTLGLWP